MARKPVAWLLLAAIPTTGAKEPPPPLAKLEPTSNWVLDYATERCSLNRAFGTGDNALILRIDSFGSWREFRFLVTGKGVPRAYRTMTEFAYRFTPDIEDRKTSTLNGTVGNDPAASFSGTFAAPEPRPKPMGGQSGLREQAIRKPIDPEFERQVNSLQLRFPTGRTLVLSLGDMVKPLEAMRTCVDDLNKSWGVDPTVQRNLSRSAVINTATIRAVQRKYPLTMLRDGTTAYVPIRLMVDAMGRVTGCVDQANAAPDEFMQAACEGLEAGKFEPALDEKGQPVASVYQTSVIYF